MVSLLPRLRNATVFRVLTDTTPDRTEKQNRILRAAVRFFRLLVVSRARKVQQLRGVMTTRLMEILIGVVNGPEHAEKTVARLVDSAHELLDPRLRGCIAESTSQTRKLSANNQQLLSPSSSTLSSKAVESAMVAQSGVERPYARPLAEPVAPVIRKISLKSAVEATGPAAGQSSKAVLEEAEGGSVGSTVEQGLDDCIVLKKRQLETGDFKFDPPTGPRKRVKTRQAGVRRPKAQRPPTHPLPSRPPRPQRDFYRPSARQ